MWSSSVSFIFIFYRLFRWFYIGQLLIFPDIWTRTHFVPSAVSPSSFISSCEVILLGSWFSLNFSIFISLTLFARWCHELYVLRMWFLSISDCCHAEYSCSICVLSVFSAKRLFIWSKCASLGVDLTGGDSSRHSRHRRTVSKPAH
jgi:hypothetical protein